ncbi:hypothetical protein [Streptomyces atratus]
MKHDREGRRHRMHPPHSRVTGVARCRTLTSDVSLETCMRNSGGNWIDKSVGDDSHG